MKENKKEKKINAASEKSLVKVDKKSNSQKENDIDITFAINTYDGKKKEKKKYIVKKENDNKKTAIYDPYEMANYKNVRIVTTKKRSVKRFPFSVFFSVIALAGMLLFLMMNYAELDRATSEITSMKSELTQLKRSEQQLSKQLDERDDLKTAEDYAKNTLGMIKKDTLPNHPISMVKEDKSDVIEYGKEDENKVIFLLSGIGRVFSNFFGSNS